MPFTRPLIVANIVAFALQAAWEDVMMAAWIARWPLGRHAAPDLPVTVSFHWWQLATSSFLPAGLLRIALNMRAPYLFEVAPINCTIRFTSTSNRCRDAQDPSRCRIRSFRNWRGPGLFPSAYGFTQRSAADPSG